MRVIIIFLIAKLVLKWIEIYAGLLCPVLLFHFVALATGCLFSYFSIHTVCGGQGIILLVSCKGHYFVYIWIAQVSIC